MKIEEVNLEVFWTIVQRLTDESTRSFYALEKTPKDDKELLSYWRRVYARAVFDVFDAAIYYMTFYAHVHQNLPDDQVFLPEELEQLNNSFDFDEYHEEVVTEFSKEKWLGQIRFALYAFAKVHELHFVPPVFEKENGWVLIREIAHIRSCLRFPQSIDELEVYDENVETLAVGLHFFVETMANLLAASVKNYEENYPHLLPENRGIDKTDEKIM